MNTRSVEQVEAHSGKNFTRCCDYAMATGLTHDDGLEGGEGGALDARGGGLVEQNA